MADMTPYERMEASKYYGTPDDPRKYRVRILWGANPLAKPIEYRFHTWLELAAFLFGVDEGHFGGSSYKRIDPLPDGRWPLEKRSV